jgi:hypothetical protein
MRASVLLLTLLAATANAAPHTYMLKSAKGLELRNAVAEEVTYRGRHALRIVETGRDGGSDQSPSLAVLPDSQFENGVIEMELAGKPHDNATGGARGFIGVAFRVASDASQFECFYLRPTNGRADDQLRRNHSTQYTAFPAFPWHKLRSENPGVYESYADLVPGEWTHVKIEVEGTKARLYVNHAPQPALIVNDLKLGSTSGRVALWIGDQTEAYFSKVIVNSRGSAGGGSD